MPTKKINQPTVKKQPSQKKSTPVKEPVHQDTPKEPLKKQPSQKKSTPVKEPVHQDTPKEPVKTQYKYIGKESINQIARKSIPRQFMITSKFLIILGIIFLAVIIIAAAEFPIEKLLSGEADITINIGYPFIFLEVKLVNQETTPFHPSNLLLDLIIYLLLAYLLDIFISFISNANVIKARKDARQKPQIYKNIKPSMADKITKQVFKK